MLSNIKKWVQNAVDSSLILDDVKPSTSKLVTSNSNFLDINSSANRNFTKQTRSASTILKPSRNSFSYNSDTDESSTDNAYNKQSYAEYNNTNGFMSKSTSTLDTNVTRKSASINQANYNRQNQNHLKTGAYNSSVTRSCISSTNSESFVESSAMSTRNEDTTAVDMSYLSTEEKVQIESVLRRAQQEDDHEKR
jgi:hypothetical protein